MESTHHIRAQMPGSGTRPSAEVGAERTAPAQKRPGAPILGVVARVVMFPTLLLVPAGTWRWTEAWLVVGLFLAWLVTTALWLHKHDPALLAERAKGNPLQEGQKTFDKILLVLFVAGGIALLLVPGFDKRWGWTSVPFAVEMVALAINIPAFLWIGWVMKENTFLSRVVKIDEDRGHKVITTGPYAFVRHPMYVAVIVMLLAFPVALGSIVGLAPAAATILLLVARTVLEDRMLHRELPGYPEYAAKTRYRLVPGVW